MNARSGVNVRKLDRFLSAQYGVISRSQAISCGITKSALRHLLRAGGPWGKIVPGVYTAGTGPVTQEQREMAALLHAGPRAVITGAAAVRRHRLQCPGLNEVAVLVPADVRCRSAGFVQLQRTTRVPEEPWSTRGIRFAPLPRAVADAARAMSRFEDVQALVCQAVQRRRCTIEELSVELNDGPSTGSHFLRAALGELAVGIRSSAEHDLKQLIGRSSLDKPMYNPRLYTRRGEFIGMPDAWWQRAGVAAEVDSRQYHMSAKDYEATTRRHNRMEAAGIHMLHFLPSSVRSEPRQTLAVLREAVTAGCRNPELLIVAVPAEVTDDAAYLAGALASASGTKGATGGAMAAPKAPTGTPVRRLGR